MIFFTHYSSTGFCNSFLIGPDDGGDAILIDPGIFDTLLLKHIEENGLYLRHVLVTHAHRGHINGIKTIVKIYDPTIYYLGQSVFDVKCTRIVDGQVLELGDFSIQVMETPGHSADSVVYRLNNQIFTGDTLFAGSIGTTADDFSRDLIVSAIKEKLLVLDDECIVFPGHGPPSKVGIERNLNPDLLEQG